MSGQSGHMRCRQQSPCQGQRPAVVVRQVLRADSVAGTSVMAVGGAVQVGLQARPQLRICYSADGAVSAVDRCNGRNSGLCKLKRVIDPRRDGRQSGRQVYMITFSCTLASQHRSPTSNKIRLTR